MIRDTQSLVFYVLFSRSLFVFFFPFCHCIVYSSIYGFWLPIWNIQTFINNNIIILNLTLLRVLFSPNIPLFYTTSSPSQTFSSLFIIFFFIWSIIMYNVIVVYNTGKWSPMFMLFNLAKNPCVPNPCGNGGKCNRRGSSFSCSCINGYTGKTCQSKFI